jgi:hypothetical protein
LLGVVETLYEQNPDPESHWKMLRSLPDGTWVRHLDRGKYYTCSQVRGVEQRGGTDWLRLGGAANLRRWDMCLDVQPLADGEEPFNRKNAAREDAFLRAFMPNVNSRAFLGSSTPLSIAVGSKAALIEELAATGLAPDGTSPLEGTAGHVVKPRLQPGLPYRTDLIAAAGDTLPGRAATGAAVGVFDGPSAILRWRHRIPAGGRVMILDRSSASSEAAVEALVADRARSIADADDRFAGPPPGVELLAYLERR